MSYMHFWIIITTPTKVETIWLKFRAWKPRQVNNWKSCNMFMKTDARGTRSLSNTLRWVGNLILWDLLQKIPGNKTKKHPAKHGHLYSLKWVLHKNGCLWDKGTCFSTVLDGHFNCRLCADVRIYPWNRYDFYIFFFVKNVTSLHFIVYLNILYSKVKK